MQAIIDQAQIVLVDEGATRWSETELLGWANAAVREIATIRPDSTNVLAAFTCAAGTQQTLPTGATMLLDVPRNVDGRAIRQVRMALLDAQRPTWHTDTAGTPKNYCYDPRTPRVFWLYPPPAADAQVEIKYQTSPAAVAIGANLPIGDEYVNAVLDYILYMAFLKDADYNPTNARALHHKAAFDARIGAKTQADAAQSPREVAEQ